MFRSKIGRIGQIGQRPQQAQLRQAFECAWSLSSTTTTSRLRGGPPSLAVRFHTARQSTWTPPRRTRDWARGAGGLAQAGGWTGGRRRWATTAAAGEPANKTILPDLDKVVALVTGAKTRLLGHPAIPSEEETATALRICGEAADLIMDATVQPQLSSIDHQADTTASTLLSLDARGKDELSQGGAAAAAVAAAAAPSPRFRDVIGQISDAAFAMIEDARVFITPQLLEQYVQIQARLGRPETLPYVLQLYASKPQPRLEHGSSTPTIRYAPQSPGKPSNAVAAKVAEAALDTALAAKDLDAAVGVVEHSYAAPAFVRAKMIRRGLLPGFAAVGVPLATYLLAMQLAQVQQTMDDSTATQVAFAAILTYIACTAAIGVVANTTANDQMRRVTWAPGTPLTARWLREDERAALDRVACAFGFSEVERYGEEEGAEFQALREYIMRKGMLMDQIELMEGMNS